MEHKADELEQKIPTSRINFIPMKKTYCASAMYVHVDLGWRADVSPAFHVGASAGGHHVATVLKGFYRRLVDAVRVTWVLDELDSLSQVQDDLINIALSKGN